MLQEYQHGPTSACQNVSKILAQPNVICPLCICPSVSHASAHVCGCQQLIMQSKLHFLQTSCRLQARRYISGLHTLRHGYLTHTCGVVYLTVGCSTSIPQHPRSFCTFPPTDRLTACLTVPVAASSHYTCILPQKCTLQDGHGLRPRASRTAYVIPTIRLPLMTTSRVLLQYHVFCHQPLQHTPCTAVFMSPCTEGRRNAIRHILVFSGLVTSGPPCRPGSC